MKRSSKSTTENKKVRNAVSNEYDGIKFRSRLETYTYKQLKLHKIDADYEQIKFTLQDSFRYKGELVRAIGYTPDFVGDEFVIECKGFANESFPLKWKMFKHFLFNNGLDFDLYLPRNQKQVDEVIQLILNKRNGTS